MSEHQEQKFPFGPAWQRTLVHLLVEDDRFAEVLAPHIQTAYFENEILQWAWATRVEHVRRYGSPPTWAALDEAAKRLDPKVRSTFVLGLEQLRQVPADDVPWVRGTAVEWVRRNIFARAFHDAREKYNAGKVDGAYDALMREMDRFADVATDVADDGDEIWLFEELPKRQIERWNRQNVNSATPTGIPEIDRLTGGGLDLGQMGIWMAYSKVGKTTMLVNLGRVAVRVSLRNVAHLYFEGTGAQISNRYDASFASELYTAVKRGEFGTQKYEVLWQEYQYYRRKLVIRGFVDRWDYSVEDIWAWLDRKRRREGWEPHVLIVDYADLLKGRGRYEDGLDSNAAAYRDLKTLSTKRQGYALWTAAQAKKPKSEDFDTKPHLLKSPDLGGRYEKVKVADFLASMNATLEERVKLKQMRIWIEAVRDSPAGLEITVPCDYERMVFGAGAGQLVGAQPIADVGMPPNVATGLGYRQVTAFSGG